MSTTTSADDTKPETTGESQAGSSRKRTLISFKTGQSIEVQERDVVMSIINIVFAVKNF